MSRATATLFRTLVPIHRWLGVALSALVLLWFASGFVMIYRSFPEVTPRDRLARAPHVDPTQVRLTPAQAAEVAGPAAGPLRSLSTFDSRPAYRFSPSPGASPATPPILVFADDGSTPAIDAAALDRAASQWSGEAVDAAVKTNVVEVDQWTVGGRLRTMRPLLKYSWPDGQQVYVNGLTAEVVQYTTTASRLWAYGGAIPHWLYFTPLRKHPEAWSSVVVWTSLAGTISAVTGLLIGAWVYSPRRRHRHAGAPTSIPYRGWKRWHTMTGLLFGVLASTWAFSGMLSMGPFPVMEQTARLLVHGSRAEPAREVGASPERIIADTLRGPSPPLSTYDAVPPAAAIAAFKNFDVRALEFTSFDGRPAYVASSSTGERRVMSVRGTPAATFDVPRISALVRQAVGSNLRDVQVLTAYDAYYRDRRGERPLPVIRVRLTDADDSRYYIDPATARIVETYEAHDWVSRWLYHGLHSLDIPWLYARRPLWDFVILACMLGGTTVAVTSLVLAGLTVTRALRRR